MNEVYNMFEDLIYSLEDIKKNSYDEFIIYKGDLKYLFRQLEGVFDE